MFRSRIAGVAGGLLAAAFVAVLSERAARAEPLNHSAIHRCRASR